jgi:trigger factor
MKSNLEKVSNLTRKLSVHIPAETVDATINKLLKSAQQSAHIKGFRKGKAPLATIKSMYLGSVKQDAVQKLLESNYIAALKEHSVLPVNQPEFEFGHLNEGQDFQFTVHFDVRPEIALKKYTGLEFKKESLKVPEEQVEKILENIRNSHAKQVDVLELRPVKAGDVAIIDFAGSIDGQPLEKGQGKDFPLEIGANQFIPGFEDGIIGMSVGNTKVLNLQFPADYGAEDLSGKKVDFNVTLKGLKQKQLPELTDEFVGQLMGASAAGGTQTLAELKNTIRKDLEETEAKRISNDLKNKVLKVLVQNNPVEVPPSMQKEQVELLIEDTKKRMLEQGLKENDFEAYKEKWKDDFQTVASEMIQAGFLIDSIAQKHELYCSEEDFQNKLHEYAVKTGIEESKIKDFYGRSEQKSKLTYSLTEEKVIKYLLENNKVTEVPAAQLD